MLPWKPGGFSLGALGYIEEGRIEEVGRCTLLTHHTREGCCDHDLVVLWTTTAYSVVLE